MPEGKMMKYKYNETTPKLEDINHFTKQGLITKFSSQLADKILL